MSGDEIERTAVEGTAVATLPERQFAVSHWLLGAADDVDVARAQWQEQGVALLACGGVLSAVRIPARLVWAAAGTKELDDVDRFLGQFFDGGAVFMDLRAGLYYALVPGFRSEWGDRVFSGAGWNALAGITSWVSPLRSSRNSVGLPTGVCPWTPRVTSLTWMR
ncbi:hypothetical protein [Streptomyces sp. NPDC001508]|uniref:hypothetical protein n=1 Tax=Streptomyces sp. NPDC001508 TaxID=3154656 RepID=UPI00332E2F8C